MTMLDDPVLPQSPPIPARRGSSQGLFRAFWRWHFYASFLVIPIVLLLAVTGSIYLLRFQLEPRLHADVMTVSVPADPTLRAGHASYAQQQLVVEAAYPDATITSMTEPRAADRATVFSITRPDGGAREVYVDPWNAKVLGALDPDTTLSGRAIRLHANLIAGRTGDLIIELAACWMIVMALTGYYLFFRGRVARARRRAAGAAGAALRSRHGWTGAIAGLGLLALVVTGLPWTGVWGAKVQQLATSRGTSLWSDDHGALSKPTSTLDESLPHSHDVPWAQGDTTVPRSDSSEAGPSVANIDTAVLVGQRQGLKHPMTVALPDAPDGVFSVIGYAFNAPSKERTVHVDRYGGTVVSTYGYRDYPLLAKAVSQGIALHEGRRFGTANLLGTLGFCAGLVFLSISGPLMWWRRRPKGASSLGAPRGRLPLRASPGLAVLVVALAVFLPLFGGSLAVVLLLDQLVLRRVPALRTRFDSPAPRPRKA